MPDIVIPIVFPDYLIAVNTPKARFKIPDLIPGIDILPDDIGIPETKNKLPELGHAGVLFIEGASGTTKYYEYGRYVNDDGQVQKLGIRDVKMTKGHPTKASLAYTLSQISAKTGHHGAISAAYIPVEGKYGAMLQYAKKRQSNNYNPKRELYSIFTNSCVHFMKGVMDAAGVDTPLMIDPRPNSYIEEIRDDYLNLDYIKKTNTLTTQEDASVTLAYSGRMQQAASA